MEREERGHDVMILREKEGRSIVNYCLDKCKSEDFAKRVRDQVGIWRSEGKDGCATSVWQLL